jgi:hypothetical protein
MSSSNTFAPEWELLEPEWEQSGSGEWEGEREWEGSGEADSFLQLLGPLAAKALPAIGHALLPAVRQLIPQAAQAIGSTVTSLLPTPTGAAGASAPAGAGGPGATQPRAPAGARSGRQRALRLIRELHGMVLRGEAEAEAAENALFGTGSRELESGHPDAGEAALTEVLAAEAAHTPNEAEAEALLGAALPITIRIMSGRTQMRRVTPALVRANARMVRGLRRSGPAGQNLLRLVPKIQRNTVATIKQQQRSGRPVSPSMVGPIMAAQATRVLGTPRKCGPALVRNAVVRQRTVAPAGRAVASAGRRPIRNPY